MADQVDPEVRRRARILPIAGFAPVRPTRPALLHLVIGRVVEEIARRREHAGEKIAEAGRTASGPVQAHCATRRVLGRCDRGWPDNRFINSSPATLKKRSEASSRLPTFEPGSDRTRSANPLVRRAGIELRHEQLRLRKDGVRVGVVEHAFQCVELAVDDGCIDR